jgi:SAM-dependent methyltransferase
MLAAAVNQVTPRIYENVDFPVILQRLAQRLKATPLHPQWLLAPPDIEQALLRERASGVVVDIGCGDRWGENHIAAECLYIGLDYPPTAMRLYNSRPNVFADAAKLPFADESIDTVLLFQTLEHVERPLEAVEEIFRVLRAGGCLLLSVPMLYPLHDEPHDYTRFTTHGLRNILETSGFEVDVIRCSLDSARTAGLIASLTLGGMVAQSFKLRTASLLFAPIVLAAIPIINIAFWLASYILPSWSAVTSGYKLVARKAEQPDSA